VRFIGKRIVALLGVLLAVTFLSFLMLSLLPGDIAVVKCAGQCDQAGLEAVRAEYGLDRPIPVRYVDWLGSALTGDLGKSLANNEPVADAIKQRLPVTLELVLLSQILALGLAIPTGILAAKKPNGGFDKASTGVAFLWLAAPAYLVAAILVAVFAVGLRWLPATGGGAGFFSDPVDNLRHMILPAISLALAETAVYSRILRTDLLTTMQEDYIMMARAKGLPSGTILRRHALRPSTFSLITVIGLNLGRLIGGALVIEQIFAIAGIGTYLYTGIFKRDPIAVQGGVVVIAVAYVLVNFAVDLLYAVLDPRIRHARAIA
jgi:peptide/nickel transport system permease protein